MEPTVVDLTETANEVDRHAPVRTDEDMKSVDQLIIFDGGERRRDR